jgi:hypothetical protein
VPCLVSLKRSSEPSLPLRLHPILHPKLVFCVTLHSMELEGGDKRIYIDA